MKFTICRLVWVIIIRPQSLNPFILASFLRSVSAPQRFCKTPSPSSLYNPTDSLSVISDKLFNKWD